MHEFNWRPGIGDPTLGGWITVLLYAMACVACWRLATTMRADTAALGRERRVWSVLAALLLALGVNKQLDLQTALTEAGRVVAYAQGWYESRRLVQFYFIIAIATLCLAAVVALVHAMRHAPAASRLAVAGTAIIFAFVAIRAASFHHVDVFIGTRVLGLRWNWILEMGGISVVVLACLLRGWQERSPPRAAALLATPRP